VWATGISYPSLIPNTNGWTTGTDFIAGLNTAGSLTYSALYASGTVAQSVAVDPAGLVHVAGMNGFVSAIPATSKPAGEVFYLENAAGGNATARLSPAEVISIYGPGIGPAAAATGTLVNGSYPKTLARVQVTIDGIAIPLLYVSANQINAVVPMALMPGAGAILRVTNGTASIDFPVWIVYFAPQAFSGVLNQDGTLNSQANPAKGGSIVTFYATGWQSDFSPLADGQVASMAQNLCQGGCPLTSGPADAAILYAGAAPGIVAGVTQFNVFLGTLPALTSVSLLNLSVSNLVFLSPAISQTFVTPALWVDP
jgi:uncharacterized protein (TIGR03437 family)